MTVTLVAADDIPVTPDDGLPPGQPYVSPDDLASIPPLFAEAAGQVLLPLVAEIWQQSAGVVHAQLVDAADLPNLPPVSSLAAETYLAQAANTFAQVGDDLWATARSELLAGFEAGESIPQLADRLRGSAGLTARKATLVARTQVLDASNAGSYATAQTSGIDLRKGWLDTPDNRTRETHRLAGAKYGADQQMIPMADQFIVGGYSCDRPHDPSLPIGERASCRCALIYSLGPQAVRDAQKAAEPVAPLPNTSGQIEPVAPPAVMPSAPLATVAEIREIEVENQIREAYRSLMARKLAANPRANEYVMLSDLRDELGAGLSRQEVDASLIRLGSGDYDGPGSPRIVPESNQSALTPANRTGAVRFGGQYKHAISFRDASPRPLPRVGGPESPLAGRTVVQLRALAKQQGIPGYSKLTKPQLLERLGPVAPRPVLEGRALRDALRERNRIIEQRAAAEQTLAELDDLLVKKASREAFEQRIAAAQLDPADLAALRAALGDPVKLRAQVTRITKKQGITVQAKAGAKVKFDPELHDPVGDVPAAGTPVVVIRRGTTLTVDGDTIALNKAVVKLPTAPVKRAPAKAVKAAVEQPQAGSAAHDAALIRRPLDRDTLATIEEYHGGWAAGMNRALRSGHGVIDPAKQDAARLARGMDELMSGQELTEAIAVDRGVVYHELVDMIGGVPKRGATYIDHGFVSTSTVKPRLRPGEENAVLHLRVPSGVRAASTPSSKGFDSFDPGEVVLDRGLTYRITTNVEMRDGVRHIDVEVVPKGKPVKRAAAKAAKAKPAEVPVSSDPKVAALPRTSGKPPLPAKAAKATNPKFGTTQQGPTYRDAAKAGKPWTPDMGPLPSGAFEENCTNTVQAFEMRMRGFDVQAAPLDVLDRYGYAAGRTMDELDDLLTASWRLPDGSPHGRSFAGQAWRSFTEIDGEIDRTWPDGGRGFIFVGKHIFNVVKVRGKAVYYEAQFDANTTRNVTALYRRKYGGESGQAKLFRVDDLEPVGGILDTITPI